MSVLNNPIVKLGPANPLLLRVVTAGGKRWRHGIIRWVYLGLLITVLLFSLLWVSLASGSLSELAKAATQVFSSISYVQLSMICLLAPIFTAGAITQESDSRTYSILLSTPLTNGQIVLGTLLSRLYYIVALLLSGVPVFAITLFYGGVTSTGIAYSFAIALGTAFFMGALAITIAVLRIGTARMVFVFYVVIVIYLVGVGLLDFYLPSVTPMAASGIRQTTFLTGIHPFLALQAVVNPTQYAVPDQASVSQHDWLIRYYLLHPVQSYLILTFCGSLLLVTTGTFGLRALAQRAEASPWKRMVRTFLAKVGIGRKSRPARSVWKNPIAWREAQTRGSNLARGLTRWISFILGGLVLVLILSAHYFASTVTTEGTRTLLLGLLIVEFSLTLLLATNIAAAAITREQETAVLDLFLVTPLTAKDYIQGKFRGMLYFILPLWLAPVIVMLVIVLMDLITRRLFDDPVIFPEVLLLYPLFTGVIIVLACLLGLSCSMRWSRTIVSVMVSVFALAGICGILGICGFIGNNAPIFGPIFSAFSPYMGISVLISPAQFAEKSLIIPGTSSGNDPARVTIETLRIIIFVAFTVSILLYAFIGRMTYRWLMHNFDLILRRQRR